MTTHKKRPPKVLPFIQLQKHIVKSRNFGLLTGNAVKLLIQIAEQFNGQNNGDLSAAYSVLNDHGWNSKQTIANALSCLTHYGFITKTRQGGKNRCNLYAVTWLPINICGGKHDVHATPKASNKWDLEAEEWSSKN